MSSVLLLPISFVLVYLYVFWLMYVLVVCLYRAHLDARLNGFTKVLAAPALAIGYLIDLLANWAFASLWFWELPKSPLELVTDRLTRYMNGPDGRKKSHARWVCETLLDPFDPSNDHCKIREK